MGVKQAALYVLNAILLVVSVSGCSGSSAPPTFRVEGKVVKKDGEPYMGGGYLEFRNLANPQDASFGQLAGDGSFTLKTIVRNRSVEGALEGEHEVRFTPKGDGQIMNTVLLKARYTVKAGETSPLIVKLEQ